MVDETVKKVLILACPRTGTTIIQKLIAVTFGINNLVEPFIDPVLAFNPVNHEKPNNVYHWAKSLTNGVIKVLATNLHFVDIEKLVNEGGFDRVVIIERRNLVHCCLSLCLAESSSKYHYYENDSVNIAQFECSETFVDNWITMYKRYITVRNQVQNFGVALDTIYYEDFMENRTQYVANRPLQSSTLDEIMLFEPGKKMLALNLDYRALCVNYDQVAEKIHQQVFE